MAEDDSGKIVAHYGILFHRTVFDGKEGKTVTIVDVMVHPVFRGIKALKRLVTFPEEPVTAEGVSFGYGFPTENTLMLPAERLGLYERIEDVMEAVKPSAPDARLAKWAFELFSLDFQDERIDILWGEFKKIFPIMIIRDRKLLEWRYKKHPLHTYVLLGLKKRWSRKLIGLAVLRRFSEEESLLMDFIFEKPYFDVLLSKVERYVKKKCGNKRLRLWAPPMLAEDFRRLGYSLRPAGTSIPLNIHTAAFRKEHLKDRFFYTMGDTDFL